jgi:hypothetical protein
VDAQQHHVAQQGGRHATVQRHPTLVANHLAQAARGPEGVGVGAAGSPREQLVSRQAGERPALLAAGTHTMFSERAEVAATAVAAALAAAPQVAPAAE